MNFLKNYYRIPGQHIERMEWIREKLSLLKKGGVLLDAGCGDQPHRSYCDHLEYKGQDFGQYEGGKSDEGLQWEEGAWEYGELDYVGDIWDIKEKDNTFDAVLCTDVLEHIPYPAEAIVEFGRLLKPGGELILTAPYAHVPHMSPYFFSSGYSKEFYEYFCEKAGLEIVELSKEGDAFSFVFQEMKRSSTFITNKFYKMLYIGAFLIACPILKLMISVYGKTKDAQDLCFGYHLHARKKAK